MPLTERTYAARNAGVDASCSVRTQERRDDNIVAIATALGLFVLLLAVGSVLIWATTRSDPTLSPIFWVVVAISATVAVVFLIRARRP
jgi:hypothetical protein